jgi:outer membrane murein-binding lipoprotein Lpp
MSEDRKITQLAEFEEPHPKTDPAPPPNGEASSDEEFAEERPSIDDLSRAVAKLESDLENQADEIRAAIEKNAHATRQSVNTVLTTVVRRMDAQAKAIRWLATEDRDRRGREGLPPLACPVDDL